MKKHILTTVVLLAGIFTVSCSNITRWSQDPFAGKDGRIKEGEEKPSEPVGPKPIPSDALRIRAPEYVSFKELRLDKFNIIGQVLLKDYVGALEIENMDDFPGATFDETSGEFSWMPAKGAAGTDLSSERVLKVRLYAQKPNEPMLMNSKDIRIGVARTFAAPEVVSVTKQANTLREGSRLSLDVQIRDNDAIPTDESSWPKLQFTSVEGKSSLANYVYVDEVRIDAGGLYTFRLYIDLRDTEITPNSDLRAFAIRAVSRFNLVSADQNVEVKVLTLLASPVSSWTEYRDVTAGSVFQHEFFIMDPKGEGIITLKNFTSLPSGADAKCTRATSGTVLSCSVKWQTDATSVGTYLGYASVELKNTDSTDGQVQSQNFQLKIRVLPAPTTTTLPPPTTTLPTANR